MTSYESAVLAEYVWLDAKQVPRSKTMTMTTLPKSIEGLRVWNYDGSSTEQADGHNSEIYLYPKAIFKDPFRGRPHILVLAEAYNAWDGQPAIGNTRAECKKIMDQYKDLDPWFGIEQEYTLMRPGRIGEEPKVPLGFNADGTEPAPQGPYYTGAGFNTAIGRPVADEHYKKCLEAGVKIAGINAEVMPGQWEFQVGLVVELRWAITSPLRATSCCASRNRTTAFALFHPNPWMEIGMEPAATPISL